MGTVLHFRCVIEGRSSDSAGWGSALCVEVYWERIGGGMGEGV